jgi:Uma2 family endonuclease
MSALTVPPPVRSLLGSAPAPKRWTAVEFDHLVGSGYFAGRRPFLIDGVILEQGPMDAPHANAVLKMARALGAVFGAGWVVRPQLPLHVDTMANPMPDFAVVRGDIDDFPTHPTTAELVVEISDSTLTADLTVKAERYAAAGIADYWVLDIAARRLLVFRDPAPVAANGNSYRTHLTLGPTDTVSPLAAPAASVRVADLLP